MTKDTIDFSGLLPEFSTEWETRARARLDILTKPQGSLGRLEDIAALMCGWQKTLSPTAAQAHTLLFAGNHGVVKRGVSAFPSEVTAQMVANFEAGGAAINQLCKEISSTLRVIPLWLEQPTQDFTEKPAMTPQECEEAFLTGMRAVPAACDILILGEMGIGNTTAAAAVAHALAGGKAEDWVGAGTGVHTDALARKRAAVAQAVALHKPALTSTQEVLRHVGGRELAAMAGAAWEARRRGIPLLLDGYVATAAVATLRLSRADGLAHCLAGHVSAEPGHRRLLQWLGLTPILDLGMRLGEGSGAQVALAIVRAALAAFNGMATFEGAGVAARHD